MTLTKDKPKVGRTTLAHAKKELASLAIPYAGETEHITIGKRYILFINVEYDQDCTNPCEDDGMGEIRSFSTRHINRIDRDKAEEILKTDSDVVPLSYYEHGKSLWMVAGESYPAGVEFTWDGVPFAGLWIPDKWTRESYSEKDGDRKEWMRKRAAACCEAYSGWANGQCYGCNVQLYKARYSDDGDLFDDRDDYRYEDAIVDDSCWGVIGVDHLKSEVRDIALYALNKLTA